MASLADEVGNVIPTHLLIVGNSKTGKSDYVAQAAKDGYRIIYADKDNGKATLMDALKGDQAAMERIHYFAPENLGDFVEKLLTREIFRYNIRTRAEFTSMSAKPGDRIVEIIPSKIPANVIFSIDSWTALCNGVHQDVAKAGGQNLLDLSKVTREIYGPSGLYVTQLAGVIQHAHFHVIVQGHSGYYERKEKPPGRNNVEEKDMLIRDTNEVPMSTSLPAGAQLPKYFNQVGYLTINVRNERQLDFRVIQGRIGGGTPAGIGDPREGYRFHKLFGRGIDPTTETDGWYREYSKEEFDEAMGRKPVANPAVTTGASNQQTAEANPKPSSGTPLAGGNLGSLFKK